MFIVPEVLWSPVGNVTYGLFANRSPHFFRDNFFITSSNSNPLIFILLIQFIGSVLSIVSLIKKKSKNYFDITILLLLGIFSSLNFLVLYLVWATRHIGT